MATTPRRGRTSDRYEEWRRVFTRTVQLHQRRKNALCTICLTFFLSTGGTRSCDFRTIFGRRAIVGSHKKNARTKKSEGGETPEKGRRRRRPESPGNVPRSPAGGRHCAPSYKIRARGDRSIEHAASFRSCIFFYFQRLQG